LYSRSSLADPPSSLVRITSSLFARISSHVNGRFVGDPPVSSTSVLLAFPRGLLGILFQLPALHFERTLLTKPSGFVREGYQGNFTSRRGKFFNFPLLPQFQAF
jgi:hypothetical protein